MLNKSKKLNNFKILMRLIKQIKKEIHKIPQIARKAIGIVLIIFGILGFFLPVLPGIFLIILGLIFLENKPLKKYVLRLIKKFKKKSKSKQYIFILIRYLILLGSMFTLSLIYKILTPLTIHSTAYLLKIFYQVSINLDFIIIDNIKIQIVSACVAGSAYLLLLILNLTLPMRLVKRIYSILLSFIILLILNILRIFILSVLLINEFKFFDLTHKLFWYVLSTLFVIGIWFLIVKIFSIKKIPVYTDLKFLIKEIKK